VSRQFLNGLQVAGSAALANGATFGSQVAASVTDLSKHLALYGTSYGLSITGGRLNLVAPGVSAIVANVNGADVVTVIPTGAGVTGTLGVSGLATLAAGLTVSSGTTSLGYTALSSGLLMSAANANIEIGAVASANTPFIDFHSSGNSTDYDGRIICSGGTTTGTGTLSFNCATGAFTGAMSCSGAMTIGGLATFSNGFAFAYNSSAIPPALDGGRIGWNYTSGSAEVDFWNTYSTSLPGYSFAWWQRTNAGGAVRLLDLGSGGALRAYGGIVNTPIGATTPNTGAFTTLSTSSTTTLGGPATITSGGLYITGASTGFEIGAPGVLNYPYIDFHSSAVANDSDARIAASGGGTGFATGVLTLTAATVALQGAVTTSSTVTAGDTVVIGSNTANFGTHLAMNGAAATQRSLRIQTAGVNRWSLFADSGAEGGGNTGSDLWLRCYDNAGGAIATPLSVTRATGLITLSNSLTVVGATSLNGTLSATGTASLGNGSANYLTVAGAASTYNVQMSAAGSDANVGMQFNPKGTGGFVVNGTSFHTGPVWCGTGSANYWIASGAAAAASPVLSVSGSDTNIDLTLTPKGAGIVRANGQLNVQGALYANTLSTNYVGLWGGATGSPAIITAAGGDTNIDIRLTPKGAGLARVAAAPAAADASTAVPSTAWVAGSGALRNLGRNRLHNGSMAVFQRGSGPFASGAFTADRWQWITNGSSPNTSVQEPGGTWTSKYILQITATLAAAQYAQVWQRLESLDCYDLVGQTLTLQLDTNYSTSAGTTTFALLLMYPNSADNYSATTSIGTYAIPVSTSRGIVTVTTGAMPAGVANGLQIVLIATQGAGTGNLIWNLTSIQLEAGNYATPYERRPIAYEQVLCGRYLQVGSFGISGYGAAGVGESSVITLSPRMRAGPTITTSGVSVINAGSQQVTALGGWALQVYAVVTGLGGYIYNGSYTASAEL
jgi:hypothetical protein